MAIATGARKQDMVVGLFDGANAVDLDKPQIVDQRRQIGTAEGPAGRRAEAVMVEKPEPGVGV